MPVPQCPLCTHPIAGLQAKSFIAVFLHEDGRTCTRTFPSAADCMAFVNRLTPPAWYEDALSTD